jgi:hypothetical protein
MYLRMYTYIHIYMFIYIAVSNFNLGQIYHELTTKRPSIDLKLSQLLLVKSYFNEVHRIDPTHLHTITATSQINWIVQE